MDGDHRIAAPSAVLILEGHEGQGVHHCHRCGWPFPNPHPSAKHRRAHKRVCGTVEGYQIIHSQHHSDDDHASDDDQHHTPSVKKNAESSGRVGDELGKLEHDLFSDAITDVSDSGISPHLEERFENVSESGKLVEQKSVEDDFHSSGVLEVEEAADRSESSDAKSEEMNKPEALANRNSQPDNVILMTSTAAELVSFNDSQSEHNSVQGTIAVVGSQDKLVSDDPLPPSESHQTVDASEGVETRESSNILDVANHSDASAIGKQEMPKSILDANEGDESEITANKYEKQEESKKLNSVDANSGIDNAALPNTTMAKKDSGENVTTLETGNEIASAEVEVISDPTIPSEKPTDFSSSQTVDMESKGLQELSENNSIERHTTISPELPKEIHVKSLTRDEDEVLASAGHSISKENAAKDDREEDAEASKSSRGISISPTPPSVKQPLPSPEGVHGNSDIVDDKVAGHVNALTEVDEKPTKQTDNASEFDSLTSRSDSLEANCGSVVSDTLETNSQKHKTHPNKADAFEAPSFMTLVQSGSEGDRVTAETETLQNNQQAKSDALEAGWFPSLSNVVNESEGRKKNEEIIAKVTNWSPVKQQQHSPLKNLVSEVKSPNTQQLPAANHKHDDETKDVGSVIASETSTNKHVEEWNSPARYPIQIKKEKKGRPFWVPFVCCSSAHRDL